MTPIDPEVLYKGTYVNSTYGEGIRVGFEKIISLDPFASDNIGRVQRIKDFFKLCLVRGSVLDVGSGLCVFLWEMKKEGWNCTAIDPDKEAVKHAVDRVGIKAYCGNFTDLGDIGHYQLITFNKVLEHVADPVKMLVKASKHLLPEFSAVYIEVPDGEMASKEGQNRQEFFIEHLHVFSMASTALMAQEAGFHVKQMERLREPSGKYTIRAFLSL